MDGYLKVQLITSLRGAKAGFDEIRRAQEIDQNRVGQASIRKSKKETGS